MSVTSAISSAQLQFSKRGKLAYATAYASFPRFEIWQAWQTCMVILLLCVCVCVCDNVRSFR